MWSLFCWHVHVLLTCPYQKVKVVQELFPQEYKKKILMTSPKSMSSLIFLDLGLPPKMAKKCKIVYNLIILCVTHGSLSSFIKHYLYLEHYHWSGLYVKILSEAQQRTVLWIYHKGQGIAYIVSRWGQGQHRQCRGLFDIFLLEHCSQSYPPENKVFIPQINLYPLNYWSQDNIFLYHPDM